MKNKKGIIIIFLSIILIAAGLVIYFTSSGEEKKERKNTASPPRPFAAIDARGLLYEKIFSSNSGIWNIGDTKLIAHTEDNSKYLVRYERILENGTKEEYESIVTIGDTKDMDFPGWAIDSKDLSEYNFIYYENN